MSSINKYISENPNEKVTTPNWVLSTLFADNKHPFRAAAAAWVYTFMLSRAEISLKNEWIDSENNVYIYFTYDEVKELLNCGTTTCWKIFRMLKKSGLISIKQQGFGLPNKIYLHTPDKKFENETVQHEASEATSEDKLRRKYAAACDYSFEDWQISQVAEVISVKMPNNTDDQRVLYFKTVYDHLARMQKKKEINNPFGYMIAMIQNGKAKNLSPRGKSPEPERDEPSFDLDAIMQYAQNTPLKYRMTNKLKE